MTDPVVIVEDEVKIARLLRDYCEQAGYPSVMIHDGDEALHWLQNNCARLVLLDLMLPGTDGLTICQNLRKHSDVLVIMITAQVEEIDRLLGLGLGAEPHRLVRFEGRAACSVNERCPHRRPFIVTLHCDPIQAAIAAQARIDNAEARAIGA